MNINIRFLTIIAFIGGIIQSATGQDAFVAEKQEGGWEKMERKPKKAWEIGVGGTLVNWSRVSFTDFQSTEDNYRYHLKSNHLMGGAHLYVARELNDWFYLDIQGTAGMAKNPFHGEKGERKWNTFYMGGMGLQFRISPLFHSKFVEPYLRVGVNYLYKDFASSYRGDFLNDPTGEAHWVADDVWNPEGRSKDKNSFVPLSFGGGVNTWLCNSFGLGLQGEYLMPVQKNLPRFVQISARIMWRIGGKTKRQEPEIRYVEVPVEHIVEKIIEKHVETPDYEESAMCCLLEQIHFEFDRDVLTTDSEKILDQMAVLLKKNADSRFLILGCTDAKGSDQYNLNLSARRAKAVYDALVKRGVSPHILKWRGVGKRASLIPETGDNQVREGDRKVILERITNVDYWNALN